MIIVNLKRETTLETGETKKVRETYLSSKETCSEATMHVMEALSQDIEVVSTKKAKFYDVIGDGDFYQAKVAMTVFEDDKEKVKTINILVSGDSFKDAAGALYTYLNTYDARVISLSQSKIKEYIK